MKKIKSKYGKIKIISGKWKGTLLKIIKNKKNLRPTKNLIRETLFNWINPIIHNKNCLDCFAGSGILGIESVSRGAYKSILLEQDITIQKKIIQNIKQLKTKQIISIHTNTIKWLKKTKNKFDLIFIDPPFKKYILLNKTIQLIEKNNILSKNSWIYIETNIYSPKIFTPKSWKICKKKITGKVIYQLYNKIY
ncbi:MAG: 16S rRNA m(2)G966 methyltransferase [Candidatus Westeberhardia cardiocondylae]|nr:16S rRNA m(2)G966 methyltransferase [Candidatus Westeberhardia cardiocondylae]